MNDRQEVMVRSYTVYGCFNQQYSIEDLAAYERNGMILADWRGERTASVGVTKDGHYV